MAFNIKAVYSGLYNNLSTICKEIFLEWEDENERPTSSKTSETEGKSSDTSIQKVRKSNPTTSSSNRRSHAIIEAPGDVFSPLESDSNSNAPSLSSSITGISLISSSKAFNLLSKPSNVTFGPVSYHNLTPQIQTPDNSGIDRMESKPKISRVSSDGTSGAMITNSIVRKSTSSTFGSFEGDSRTKFPKKVHRNQTQKAQIPKLPSSTSSETSNLPSSTTTTSSSNQSPPKQKNKPSAASTPLRQAREAMPVRSILRGSTSGSTSSTKSTSGSGSTSGPTSGTTPGTTSSTKESSSSKTTEKEMNETVGTEANNCSTTSSDWQFGKKLPRPKNQSTVTSTTTNPTDSSTVINSENHKREEKNVLCIFRENQTLAIGTVIDMGCR